MLLREHEVDRAEIARLIRELDAYKKAKAENDERFMLERDEARADLRIVRAELGRVQTEATRQIMLAMQETRDLRAAANEMREKLTRHGFTSPFLDHICEPGEAQEKLKP